MLEDVLADVQPQTEHERRECLDALQEAKNSLPFAVRTVVPTWLLDKCNLVLAVEAGGRQVVVRTGVPTWLLDNHNLVLAI